MAIPDYAFPFLHAFMPSIYLYTLYVLTYIVIQGDFVSPFEFCKISQMSPEVSGLLCFIYILYDFIWFSPDFPWFSLILPDFLWFIVIFSDFFQIFLIFPDFCKIVLKCYWNFGISSWETSRFIHVFGPGPNRKKHNIYVSLMYP